MDGSLISISAAELYPHLRMASARTLVARTPSTPMIGHAISFEVGER